MICNLFPCCLPTQWIIIEIPPRYQEKMVWKKVIYSKCSALWVSLSLPWRCSCGCLFTPTIIKAVVQPFYASKCSEFVPTNKPLALYLKDKTFVCKHILTVDEGTVVPFHHVRVNFFPSWTNPTDISWNVQMAFTCLRHIFDTVDGQNPAPVRRFKNTVLQLIAFSYTVFSSYQLVQDFVHQPYCPMQHFT